MKPCWVSGGTLCEDCTTYVEAVYFEGFIMLLEDEGQHSVFRYKAVQCILHKVHLGDNHDMEMQ